MVAVRIRNPSPHPGASVAGRTTFVPAQPDLGATFLTCRTDVRSAPRIFGCPHTNSIPQWSDRD
jgi:hypothetical protein